MVCCCQKMDDTMKIKLMTEGLMKRYKKLSHEEAHYLGVRLFVGQSQKEIVDRLIEKLVTTSKQIKALQNKSRRNGQVPMEKIKSRMLTLAQLQISIHRYNNLIIFLRENEVS